MQAHVTVASALDRATCKVQSGLSHFQGSRYAVRRIDDDEPATGGNVPHKGTSTTARQPVKVGIGDSTGSEGGFAMARFCTLRQPRNFFVEQQYQGVTYVRLSGVTSSSGLRRQLAWNCAKSTSSQTLTDLRSGHKNRFENCGQDTSAPPHGVSNMRFRIGGDQC